MDANFPVLDDPLLAGLLAKLPTPGSEWPWSARSRWESMFSLALEEVYGEDDRCPNGAPVCEGPRSSDALPFSPSFEGPVKGFPPGLSPAPQEVVQKEAASRKDPARPVRDDGRHGGSKQRMGLDKSGKAVSPRDMVLSVMTADVELQKKAILKRVMARYNLSMFRQPDSVLYYTLKNMEKEGLVVEGLDGWMRAEKV